MSDLDNSNLQYNSDLEYKEKYLKYKAKYLHLKELNEQDGGFTKAIAKTVNVTDESWVGHFLIFFNKNDVPNEAKNFLLSVQNFISKKDPNMTKHFKKETLNKFGKNLWYISGKIGRDIVKKNIPTSEANKLCLCGCPEIKKTLTKKFSDSKDSGKNQEIMREAIKEIHCIKTNAIDKLCKGIKEHEKSFVCPPIKDIWYGVHIDAPLKTDCYIIDVIEVNTDGLVCKTTTTTTNVDTPQENNNNEVEKPQ